jgi:ATPase subunit of ABC transporter with duplicated ATPase domains
MGSEKICIIGKNGAGKTTLLRSILKELKQKEFNVGYMPQDYSEIMSIADNAIEFLGGYKNKEELTKIRTYLGSMNFTPEEMFHSVDSLSGGQRAKLFFSKMILNHSEVLILDEPTRNLSPLSGPEIRLAIQNFKGCVIAVSHDRKFIMEVFDKIYYLDENGLKEKDKQIYFEYR